MSLLKESVFSANVRKSFFFAWQAGSRVFQAAGQRYLMIFIHLVAAICRTGIDCQLCLGFRQGFLVIPWHPSVRVLDQFG